MKITNTTQRGTKGAMASFFGAGIQQATQTDSTGDKFYDAFGSQWANIFLAFIRSPNGTDIYDIVDTNDADVRAALDVLIPAKGCLSDVTWPPQLDPVTDIQALTSSATQRLVYGNEPPSHIPTVWADGTAYADDAKTWYDALSSENKAKAWIQTGKPEVIRYSLAGAAGIAKHQDCLDEAKIKVDAGELPARVATTHKLNDGYIEDRYAFYAQLIADYQSYFGSNVKVLFHEYKLKDSLADSLEQLQLVMEFWLVMARLKFFHGDTIEGGSFQQLAAVGTTNIFGMDNTAAQGGIWRVGGMYNLWQTIAAPMREQAYIYTTQEGKPANVQVETFGNDNEQWSLFSNLGDAVSLSVEGQKMSYIDSSLTVKTAPWTSSLPAQSVGVIQSYRVKPQRRSIFYYLRNLFR